MRISIITKCLLAAAAASVPLVGNAESSTTTGAGALTATAHVDFQITIPKFVSLRVGTTGAGNIDLITWNVGAAVVGNNTPIAGTGGDLTGGVETAAVLANAGVVTLSSQTTGALNDGAAGDTLSYTQIKTTASANTTATILAAPALADGATTSVSLTPVAKIVQQDAKWAYTYLNATTPPAGTYGGAGGVQAGRVTYTASVL